METHYAETYMPDEDKIEEECNETYSTFQKNTLLIIAGCNGTISFATCLVAVSLVICLRLYKIFTYRLAMYQVLAGMMFSFSVMLFFGSIGYNRNDLLYVIVCKMQAFLTSYFLWVKLFFTMNLMFHLLCLSVFMKNFKRLEMFYVLFSTLFPLTFTWIPFLHDNYDIAGAWCWIRDWKDDCASKHYLEGIIEQFALWYGPLVVFLVISVVMALVIFSVLLWRIYRIFSFETLPLLDSNGLRGRQKKMLRDLIPLLAYPIIFCLISLVPVTNRVYNAISHTPSYDLTVFHAVTNYSMGFFSASVLITHVIVVKCSKDNIRSSMIVNGDSTVVPAVPATTKSSATVFVIPAESDIDRLFSDIFNNSTVFGICFAL